MSNSNIWLFKGSFDDALAYGRGIPVANHLGYVYVLSLAEHICKLGCTQNIAQRLSTYRSEMTRYGRSAIHCAISRPHFNYHTVEQQALHAVNAPRHGEVIMASEDTICAEIEKQHLDFVAPPAYSTKYRAANAFFSAVADELIASMKTIPMPSLIPTVQNALKAHHDLGRLSGLSQAESMINALAVIEADTGLDLSAMRLVVEEVA